MLNKIYAFCLVVILLCCVVLVGGFLLTDFSNLALADALFGTVIVCGCVLACIAVWWVLEDIRENV